MTPDEAFPLAWPAGWPRCKAPSRSKFGEYSLYKARLNLQHKLRLLSATDVVISTNIRQRQDGLPYSNVREPDDHGVAVYFRMKGEPRVLACDRWNLVAHNMVALAKHVEAIRGQVRWGVGSLEQAFGGYRALPAMPPVKAWYEILGVAEDAPWPAVEQKRIELLTKHHPDRTGGSGSSLAAEINAAFDQGFKERRA